MIYSAQTDHKEHVNKNDRTNAYDPVCVSCLADSERWIHPPVTFQCSVTEARLSEPSVYSQTM